MRNGVDARRDQEAAGVRAAGRVALSASAAALLLAACAQGPDRRASNEPRSREIGAFSHPKYGKASPRVVAEGDPVPVGGGRDMIGRTYRVAGRSYTPRENPNYSATGRASWYGVAFQGRMTANGEIYDRHGFTAAHPTMPLPSYARVTNLANNRSMIVRVNDRGPYHGGRIIDVSQRTAEALEFRHIGTATLRVDYIGRAHLGGSDSHRLHATLRTDGAPAQLPGGAPTATPVMIAAAEARRGPVMPEARTEAPAVAVATVATPAASPSLLAFTGALRRDAPAPASAAPTAPVPAASETPSRATGVAANVPLPPSRPFDLGAAAATTAQLRAPGAEPQQLASRETPDAAILRRAQTAALFYAPVSSLDAPTRTFTLASVAFQGLRTDGFGASEPRAAAPAARPDLAAR